LVRTPFLRPYLAPKSASKSTLASETTFRSEEITMAVIGGKDRLLAAAHTAKKGF
jgi:hypothetical protein